MDLSRAKQIMKSDNLIEVMYNGDPVWIEDVDSEQNTALISSTMFDDKKTVSVDRLIEAGPM